MPRAENKDGTQSQSREREPKSRVSWGDLVLSWVWEAGGWAFRISCGTWELEPSYVLTKSKKSGRASPYTKWELDIPWTLPREVTKGLTFCLGSEEERGQLQNADWCCVSVLSKRPPELSAYIPLLKGNTQTGPRPAECIGPFTEANIRPLCRDALTTRSQFIKESTIHKGKV